MKEFAEHITILYLIHALILTLACFLIGTTLFRMFRNESNSWKWFVPFYNIYLWLKKAGLPGWLLILIFQVYWYPVWYIQALGAGVLALILVRTNVTVGSLHLNKWFVVSFTTSFAILYYFIDPVWIAHLVLFLIVIIFLITADRKKIRKYEFIDNPIRRSWQKFRKNRLAYISLHILGVLVFLALYSPYIASNYPLAIELENGKIIHPAYMELHASNTIIEELNSSIERADWQSMERKLMPPVPYLPTYQDSYNRNFVGPWVNQRLALYRPEDQSLYRHKLGTDRIGRDILSGVIHGTKSALTVGLVAMGIAALLGIFIGIISGYYGNERFLLSRIQVILLIVGGFLGYFYAFVALEGSSSDPESFTNSIWYILIQILIFFTVPIVLVRFGRIVRKGWLSKYVHIPLDSILMRFTELIYAIPALLLVIILASILPEKNLYMVMVIIGVISWTGIARLTRAETLSVSRREYIETARALGMKESEIIRRHVLPNVLGPVLVVVSFGMASAVLLESSLSFLGIGVPPETVTWGSMINSAFISHNSDKIWLIIVPGIAIFTIVCLYNLIGEALRDAFDPKINN